MWTRFAHFVLKRRLFLILTLAVYTAFMGYQAQYARIAYDFSQIVPDEDEDMIYYQQFRQTFGQDGTVLGIGLEDSAVFAPENFRRLRYFSNALRDVKGVKEVISLPQLVKMVRNTEARRFDFAPLFTDIPDDAPTLDSLLRAAGELGIYRGRVLNDSTGATILLVSIEKEVLNSELRGQLMTDIEYLGDAFTESTGIALHYAGLPYVRSVMMTKVKGELNLFLILSLCVTAVILFIFFRSFKAVLIPMIVIGIVVISTVGTLGLLDYRITLLTGLLPPIIVVISVPNSIYLINKYHQEYFKHRNQAKALSYIIRRIGVVTLLTNATTAVGFSVLAFTSIDILREFGIVAGLNVLVAFVVSITLIPAIFAYLPPPDVRHLKHLEFKPVARFLHGLDLLVHRHPISIFVAAGLIVVVSVVGMWQLRTVAFLVDDLPEDSSIKQDLYWFERNFDGVMPLEVVIDTQKPRGALELSTLRIIDEFETFLASQPDISVPTSAVQYLKAANQAFFNDRPDAYRLPTTRTRNIILSYLQNQQAAAAGDSAQQSVYSAFVDSTGQRLRLSFNVKDLGSIRLDTLMRQTVRPAIDSLFADTEFDVIVTGVTLIFIKGNQYLIENLRTSLLIAVAIIALIMASLFGNFRMIVLSLIPNLIPLLITAGLMGYFGVPLKPSTVLVFSIAFGISVDDSIHFLAKYRQELRYHEHFVSKAISVSIKETGTSMLYTSVILFAGFVTFVFSGFGGTQALGALISITLFCAMLTNLIVLPALLLVFDSGKYNSDYEPLIEHYEEFYTESEDEEIDLNMIELSRRPTDEKQP